MRFKLRKVEDGEWSSTRKLRDGTHVHKIKCCDCGLIHTVQYELTKRGTLRFRAWRVNHRTPTVRRSRRIV